MQWWVMFCKLTIFQFSYKIVLISFSNAVDNDFTNSTKENWVYLQIVPFTSTKSLSQIQGRQSYYTKI